MFIGVSVSSAAVEFGGIITGDTVWTNDDVVIVRDSLVVDSTGHLTIQPGTTVLFELMTPVFIYGRLTAVGNEAAPIVFTTIADTVGGTPTSSTFWYGLSFQEGSDGEMEHCRVAYTLTCIDINMCSLEFHHCTVENFLGFGFYIDGMFEIPPIEVVIDGCVIRQTDPDLLDDGRGIYVFRSVNIGISHTRIRDCNIGIQLYSYNAYNPRFNIFRTEIASHWTDGLYLNGSG